MSAYLSLALKSIANRKLSTALTALSIALSAGLLIGVEHIRQGARESFRGVISQTDLVVGARTGSLQLLLYSVFHMGAATANVSYASFERYRAHPAVKWAIPISLGDSHRGYRVVATDRSFLDHYRFRNDRRVELAEGAWPEGVFDVALGSEVAEALGYAPGKKIVIAHGMSARSLMNHDDKPFVVVGVLKRTATPVDRALYITLEGMEAIHIDWSDGAPPLPGEETPAESIRKADIRIKSITAFLVGAESRIDTLRLQREINVDPAEPLLAVIPGVALAELWRTMGYAENALFAITIIVVLVGLAGMLMSIYATLNERRREMAILRALGARPAQIVALFVFESGVLSFLGALLGTALFYGALLIARPLVEDSLGLVLPLRMLGATEFYYLGGIVLAGLLIGLLPALRAYRNALADGLTIRV